MKTRTFILLLVSSLSLFYCGSTKSSYSNTQPRTFFDASSLPPPSKYGACYLKYVTQDVYKKVEKSIIVYTGNKTMEEVGFELKRIEIEPAKSQWVRKRLPPDQCKPTNNPNDCVVACLEETPAVYQEFKVLNDTIQTADFKLVNLDQEIVIEKGGQSYWIEIVCEKNITHSLLTKVQQSLNERGFYSKEINGEFDETTIESLKKFQQSKRLPMT